MTETNHNPPPLPPPEPSNPLGYNPATDSFAPSSDKYRPGSPGQVSFDHPGVPAAPKKRKLGWLPWALLPVAFFLGVGAGASSGAEEGTLEPSEPTSEDGGAAGVETPEEAPAEPEMSEEEASFLVLLEMEATSETIDIAEDSDELRLLGHKVCGWLDQGDDLEAVIMKLLGESNGIGLDNTGMGEVAGAAVATLCQEHLEAVTG